MSKPKGVIPTAATDHRPRWYVFTTEFGQPSDPRNALRALRPRRSVPSCRRPLGCTLLRHPVASVMLSAGMPLKVVSEIFGHASVAITGDVYGPVSPDVSRDALTRATHLREKWWSKMIKILKPARSGRQIGLLTSPFT
jgi:site-specific recombinase XerD